MQFKRLEQDSMVSRRSRDLGGQELVVLVEEQPPYVQFGTLDYFWPHSIRLPNSQLHLKC